MRVPMGQNPNDFISRRPKKYAGDRKLEEGILRRLYNWILRKLGIRKRRITKGWKIGRTATIIKPDWPIIIEMKDDD